MKRQDPALETATVPAEEVQQPLTKLIQRIADDSREQTEQYLSDTVVPDGGE